MKTCICCGVSKPISEFHKHKQMKDGHINKCKECVRRYVKQWKNDNHDKVIENVKKNQLQSIVRSTRQRTGESVSKDVFQLVLERDGNTCRYCGKENLLGHNLTFDHLVPISKNGKTTPGNLVVACRSCNSRKANWSAEEFTRFLKKGIKVCTRWRKEKPLNEFHNLKSSADGHVQRCKQCCSEIKKEARMMENETNSH